MAASVAALFAAFPAAAEKTHEQRLPPPFPAPVAPPPQQEQVNPSSSSNQQLLSRSWSLWSLLDRDSAVGGQAITAWEDAQQCLEGPVSSVPEFWRLVRVVHPMSVLYSADYSIFLDGVYPAREDPQLRQGGRWILAIGAGGGPQRGRIAEGRFARVLNQVWQMVILSTVGEDFGPSTRSACICGVVISLRAKPQKETTSRSATNAKLALWLCHSQDDEHVRNIGRALLQALASQISREDAPRGGWQLAFENFEQRSVTHRLTE